jgi:predicted XRE-type DNA-binding protein
MFRAVPRTLISHRLTIDNGVRVGTAKRKRRGSQPGVRNPFIKKEELLAEIQSIVDKRDMSQVEVADETGEARSQVSLLLNGKLRGFSTDRLARILLRMGRDIEIVIRPARGNKKVGAVRLVRR